MPPPEAATTTSEGARARAGEDETTVTTTTTTGEEGRTPTTDHHTRTRCRMISEMMVEHLETIRRSQRPAEGEEVAWCGCGWV